MNAACRSRIAWILVGIVLVMSLPAHGAEIRGCVTDSASGAPLAGANLHLLGTRLGTVCDSTGRYAIRDLPTGSYLLQASLVGYRTVVIRDLAVSTDEVLRRDVALSIAVLTLDEMVVTPGRFSVLGRDPAVPQTLSREEIRTMPQLGEDIYRAIGRLPGISGGDFSARFNVRGGDHDQVLVTLDGLELDEPFHLKDIAGGALSIVDVEVIGKVDLMTGGFPADYGNRQSAVLAMESRKPQPGRRISAGVGLTNIRVLAEGGTEDTGWLISARRGYIDFVLKLMQEEYTPSPDFYDLFGRLTFGSGGRHRFGLNVLWASDRLHFTAEEGDYRFDSAYGIVYSWLTCDATYGSRLHVRSLPYVGRLTQDRDGETRLNREDARYELSDPQGVDEMVDDARRTTVYGLKSDWKVEAGSQHLARFGFDVRGLRADYDYMNRSWGRLRPGPPIHVSHDTTRAVPRPRGWQAGLYLSDKWRVVGPLTVDLGLRYDRQSYTGEGQTSPRAAVALSLGAHTVLRGAWGRFYQAQGIGDLDVQDGVEAFSPAQLATHKVIGLETRPGAGMQIRLEGYWKALKHIRERFDNLRGEIEFLPEIEGDRVRLFPVTGRTRGIEVYARRDTGGRLGWWMSYALAQTRETHHPDLGDRRFRGKTLPREYDQTHTFSVDLAYRPSPAWSVSMAWQIRSGWPYTSRELVRRTWMDGVERVTVEDGEVYGVRYPPYHRLDIRLSRRFTFQRWGLFVSLEVTNAYDRENVRRYFYRYYRSSETLIREPEKWLPLLPSLTVGAEF